MNNLSNATHSPPKLCHENMFSCFFQPLPASRLEGKVVSSLFQYLSWVSCLFMDGIWIIFMFQAGTVVELSKHRYQPDSNYVTVLI